MTTVWLATSGEYSDYRVQHVFAREEDARAYELADDVQERVLQDGPVEVRTWHELDWRTWIPGRDGDSSRNANPYWSSGRKDFDGRESHTEHHWLETIYGPRLQVGGWDLERVRKVYSEQRAQHLALQP